MSSWTILFVLSVVCIIDNSVWHQENLNIYFDALNMYSDMILRAHNVRYTPYFFDKNLLDNILEASVDQHFDSIMQNRHTQRRRDIVDDSLTSEIIEESVESLLEPPEVL
jgi:hypothetical protein